MLDAIRSIPIIPINVSNFNSPTVLFYAKFKGAKRQSESESEILHFIVKQNVLVSCVRKSAVSGDWHKFPFEILTCLWSGFSRSIHSHFDGLVVGGHLRWTRWNCYCEGETFSCNKLQWDTKNSLDHSKRGNDWFEFKIVGKFYQKERKIVQQCNTILQ